MCLKGSDNLQGQFAGVDLPCVLASNFHCLLPTVPHSGMGDRFPHKTEKSFPRPLEFLHAMTQPSPANLPAASVWYQLQNLKVLVSGIVMLIKVSEVKIRATLPQLDAGSIHIRPQSE